MSEPIANSATEAVTNVIASADPEFAWTDVGIVLIVVLAAFGFLTRRFLQKRGGCPECGSSDGHCKVKTDSDGTVTKVPVDQIHGRSS